MYLIFSHHFLSFALFHPPLLLSLSPSLSTKYLYRSECEHVFFLRSIFTRTNRQCDPARLSCRFRIFDMVRSFHNQTEGNTCLYKILLLPKANNFKRRRIGRENFSGQQRRSRHRLFYPSYNTLVIPNVALTSFFL